jgi:N-acetylglucosaminyl-diphospho-decaprenol L-rhamnosyltransferase
MKVCISIVSHGHQAHINEISLIKNLTGFNIILRENVPHSSRLVQEKICYYQNLNKAGFSSNNNRNFEAAALEPLDWFVICNPDVEVARGQVESLIEAAVYEGALVAAPLLWDDRTEQPDDNVRPMVRLLPLLLSFLGLPKYSRYDPGELMEHRTVDWASGAFLLVRADAFASVGGFDERFFMYMEDVDLCKRLTLSGQPVHYFPHVKIIHRAARDNRRLGSLAFWRHLHSLIRFLFS